MKVWVNGMVVEESEALVSALDHGLLVGDGVFETAKVVDGRPFALSRHLDRLVASARGMDLLEPDVDLVGQAVESALVENGALPGSGHPTLRLRITYTSGLGPLGSDRGSGAPTLAVALAPATVWASTTSIASVPWVRNERSATAGLKTTSYAENVRMLAHARARGASEAVMANTVGHLCEGTGSNVFVVLGGDLLTPPLSSGCLAGITRALLLEWVGGQERDLPYDVLQEADEILLTSSTRDVLPVAAVDGRALQAPGPVSAKAMEVFATRAAEDIDP